MYDLKSSPDSPATCVFRPHVLTASTASFRLGLVLWLTVAAGLGLGRADTFVNRVGPLGSVQAVTLTGDTVFTTAGSPYIVEDLLAIAGTLAVEPGTVVKVNANRHLLVTGAGRLLATNATFTVNGTGKWRGLWWTGLLGENPGSVLQDCTISQAGALMGYINFENRYTAVLIHGAAQVRLSGCTIEDSAGHGIELIDNGATIENCVFRNLGATAYAVNLSYADYDTFPALSGNRGSGTGILGVGVRQGAIDQASRWRKAGADFPYYLNGTVALGATPEAVWQIDPGTVLKMAAGSMLDINGTLKAVGTSTEPILVTSAQAAPTAGAWRGVRFAANAGQSELAYCQFSYAGALLGYYFFENRYATLFVNHCSPKLDRVTIDRGAGHGIELYAASPTLAQCTIQDCARSGLFAGSASRPTLTGVTFARNGSAGPYAVSLDAASDAAATGSVFLDNPRQGIQVRGGELPADAVWEPWATNAPYAVTGDVTVPPAGTLRVLPRTQVKLAGAKLWILGELQADGTDDSIVFTSLLDDTVGGDTNGDGGTTQPAGGNWRGLYLGPDAGASVLKRCTVRYAGDLLGYIHFANRYTGVYVDASAPRFVQCRVADSSGHGLELYDAPAVVTGTGFENFGPTGYPLVLDTVSAFPTLAGNTLAGTGILGVAVPAGTMTGTNLWTLPGPNFPYFLNGELTLAADAQWTLEAGVTVRAAGQRAVVYGTLLAQGTATAPVTFASRNATPAAGDWKGLYFGPQAGGSKLTHVNVLHAGAGPLGYIHFENRYAALYLDLCSPVFAHLTVGQSLWNGLELYGASPTLTDSAVRDCGRHALKAEAGSRPLLTRVHLSGNGTRDAGYYTVGTDATSVPDPTEVSFETNRLQGVQIWGGTLDANATWKHWGPAAPYVVTANLTVADAVTLTVAPSAAVKFQNCGLYVNGVVLADGAPDRIHFTSWRDDAAGGDSNGDATTTAPAPGDWKGIYLSPASDASRFHRCTFRYAGQNTLGYYNFANRLVTLYLDRCSPVISHCTFARSAAHGLELYDSAATVQQCVFEDFGASAYPLVFNTLTQFPTLSGNSIAGAGVHGIYVPGGTLPAESAWSYPGPDLPYVLAGELTVPANGRLTIAPGVRVVTVGQRMVVQGNLQAVGTVEAPIHFTSSAAQPAAGDWKGLYFGPGSSASRLEHVTIAHAGRDTIGYINFANRYTSLYVDQASPQFAWLVVTNSLWNGVEIYAGSPLLTDAWIAGCGGHGLKAEAGSRPTVTRVHFLNNGAQGNGWYTVGTDATSVPTPTGTTFAGNRKSGIEIWGGTLAADALWKVWATNAPYVVTANATVNEGVALMIDPGAAVQFHGSGLFVNGTLTARGDPAPIVFTSALDDAVAGDANGDEAGSLPSAGDWRGIYLGPTASASLFQRCTFRYGGALLGYYNFANRYTLVYANGCAPAFADCVFANGAGHGLEIQSASPRVTACAFSNFGTDAYPIVLGTLDCFPPLAGNTLSGTGQGGIAVPGGTMATSGTWLKPGENFPYLLTGDVTVAAGVALELEPGVAVKSDGRGLYVNGTLIAVGTVDQPIAFTSRKAAPAPGDWRGLYFGPEAGKSRLTFVNVAHAGSLLGYFNFANRYAALYVNQSSPALSHLQVRHSSGYGLEFEGSGALLDSSLVRSNAGGGIRIVSGANTAIVNDTVVENGGFGVRLASGTARLVNCLVAFNAGDGVARDAGTLDAHHNGVFGHGVDYRGVTPGAGALADDPRFLDRSAGNFRLASASPAVDAGDNGAIGSFWMDLDARLRSHGAAVDLGAYEFGAPAAEHLIDSLVRNAGDAAFIGAGLLDLAAQTKSQPATPVAPAVYHIRVQYGGNLPDSVRLRATAPLTGWLVRSFDAFTGGNELTAGLLGSSGWVRTNVAPGFAQDLRLEIAPDPGLPGHATGEVLLEARSLSEPTRRDTVRLLTFNAPRYQPDLMVRREADVRALGDNVYNLTGADQTRSQPADADVPVLYIVRLVNDGNLTDQFALQGPPGGNGWTVRYFDAATGGQDITAAVTGTGYVTPLLPLAAGLDFRLEVTASTAVAGGAVHNLLLGASSLAEPARLDAIRTVTTLTPISDVPLGGLYTLDADFERGTLVGLEYGTVPDQLQLARESTTLPFIWVPNSDQGTVSKVDTRTGHELGRYRVSPVSTSSPSRTTVDQQGSCWVANRVTGTAVKIGLLENGQYLDRNGNGTIETSRDLDGDGDITGDELLPWGEDECVLFEIVLIPGQEGTFAPGKFTGAYANNNWDPGPRGVAVDAQGHVWLGTYTTKKFYHVDGQTGQILRTVDVAAANHTSYGALIDAQGIVWSSGQDKGHVLRLDPKDASFRTIAIGHFVYGLGLDRHNHLFISGWQDSKLSRLDVLTGVKEWTREGYYQSRGIAVTDDGDVWVANSGPGTVTRWSNDGVVKAVIPVGNTPTGTAIDAAGRVWAVNYGDDTIVRIDPFTGRVDLTKHLLGTAHYGYSDMTGIISRNATTRLGVWTVVHDSRHPGSTWGTVSWTASTPEGSTAKVRVRSSTDRRTWSLWQPAVNGQALVGVPAGKYLEVEVTLQTGTDHAVPILYDLTVTPAGGSPTPPALAFRVLAGHLLELSWPATATGFVLQSTDDLTPPVTWSPVPGVQGTTVVLPLDLNVRTRFFRLRK